MFMHIFDTCTVPILQLCNTITAEKHMNSKQSSMEILASISKLQSKGSCKEADWNAYLDYFKTPVKYNANDRSWFVSIDCV